MPDTHEQVERVRLLGGDYDGIDVTVDVTHDHVSYGKTGQYWQYDRTKECTRDGTPIFRFSRTHS